MGDLTIPLMIGAAVLLLLLFIRIIRLPLKWMAKGALHAAVGFVALFVLLKNNTFRQFLLLALFIALTVFICDPLPSLSLMTSRFDGSVTFSHVHGRRTNIVVPVW